MIKRRFYKEQHQDNDGDSDSASSSSSDSEIEAEQTENTEPEGVETESESEEQDKKDEQRGVSRAKPGRLQVPSPSSSSGCASEDGSLVQVPAYPSAGIDSNDDDEIESRKGRKKMSKLIRASNSDDVEDDDGLKYVLLSKSAFKCRICPKIVCLNEETLKLHLQSKRHARSEKLLSNGKLKCMLNSDGEEENLEEEGETHAERHARILSLATSQKEEAKKKITGGRQRQRMRLKSKKGNDSSAVKDSCGKEDIAMKKKNLKDAKQPSGKEGIATTTKKKSQKDGMKSSGKEEIATATKKKRLEDAKESFVKRAIATNKRRRKDAAK